MIRSLQVYETLKWSKPKYGTRVVGPGNWVMSTKKGELSWHLFPSAFTPFMPINILLSTLLCARHHTRVFTERMKISVYLYRYWTLNIVLLNYTSLVIRLKGVIKIRWRQTNFIKDRGDWGCYGKTNPLYSIIFGPFSLCREWTYHPNSFPKANMVVNQRDLSWKNTNSNYSGLKSFNVSTSYSIMLL